MSATRGGPPLPGYPVPPATMTDLYELTMAAGYWKLGRTDERAIFTLSFRQAPFGGGFTIAAGLEGVIAFIERFRSTPNSPNASGSNSECGGTWMVPPWSCA